VAKAIVFTRNFKKNYRNMPAAIKDRFDKQLALFELNPMHPSLKIHRYKTVEDVWEGYVTDKYRFTFSSAKTEYIFRTVGPHGIIDKGYV